MPANSLRSDGFSAPIDLRRLLKQTPAQGPLLGVASHYQLRVCLRGLPC